MNSTTARRGFRLFIHHSLFVIHYSLSDPLGSHAVLVGVARLELAASCSQSKRPTIWATPRYILYAIRPQRTADYRILTQRDPFVKRGSLCVYYHAVIFPNLRGTRPEAVIPIRRCRRAKRSPRGTVRRAYRSSSTSQASGAGAGSQRKRAPCTPLPLCRIRGLCLCS